MQQIKNSANPVGTFFSTLGKSLQLPIAVLPIAGLLLRLGQPDLLGNPAFGVWGSFLASSADGIFANLALIFAIGVAVGFSKDHHGASALAGAISYLILTKGLATLKPTIDLSTFAGLEQYGIVPVSTGVLGGIVSGIIGGGCYNRYKDIILPPYLAFFGGKRFVPIISGLISILVAAIFAVIWPPVQIGIAYFGNWMIESGNLGLFAYGFFNRLLLPIGLHQVLNTLVWFQMGSFVNAAGDIVSGDLARYFAKDPTAGHFMAGMFPVMMFGLPAACFAMIHMSKPENRKATSGLLISAAITSFITGITEPIEFAFMFVAFPLYIVHAILTGLAPVIMNMLNVRLGFTFSAGLVDFILNSNLGADTVPLFPKNFGNMIWTVIIGLGYFALYYVLFVTAIKIWNLKTPGREDNVKTSPNNFASFNERASHFLDGIGGKANVISIDACATRLRVIIRDNTKVDEVALKAAGAHGVMNKIKGNCQVIIGPDAAQVADQIANMLKAE